MPEQWALGKLQHHARNHFDPEVVETFCATWPRFENAEVQPRSAALPA